LDESWDGVVNGIRATMSYDSARGSFSGIVENTTNKTIRSIVIELNLKQGTKTVVELGPYLVGDLAPGKHSTVELLVSDEPEAAGVKFNAWQIHPEAEGSEGNKSGREESGNTLSLNETYDVVRNGARLIMSYDKKTNTFKGTVENVTRNFLRRVRVEIHLSNGTELGPTTPVNLPPGKKVNVKLRATAKKFYGWTPHAEVGSGENGEEGNESSGEHGGEGSSDGSEGSGEHGSEGGN
ncbi:MAG: hypothetical protein MI862_15510, partial [Desulfobacterales bacterium]|nr:hypothetical protein [Desulfobacterales bacterium]